MTKDARATGQSFATRLNAIMEERHLSLDALIEKSGIPRTTMLGWLDGDHKPSNLRICYQLAEALDLQQPAHQEQLWQLLKLYDEKLPTQDANFRKAVIGQKGLLAFDEAWLETQPSGKRFGLYLAACRDEQNFARRSTLKDADDAPTHSHWTSAVSLPNLDSLYRFLKPLGLLEDECKPRLQRLLELHSPKENWKEDNGRLVDSFMLHRGLLAFDSKWLAQEPDPNKRFGKYLGACCIASDFSSEDVAAKIEVSPFLVNNWRGGQKIPEIDLLYKLADTLGLLAPGRSERLKGLLKVYRPKLNWEMDAQPLQAAFKNNAGFVAFSDEWLNLQPEEKRFGLYFAACRERANLIQEKVEAKAQIEHGNISNWENGVNRPPIKTLHAAAEEIGLLHDEGVNELAHVQAKRLHRLLSLYDPELNWSLGASLTQQAFTHTEGYLPLSHMWLESQPVAKRFGLYFSACEQKSGMSLDDVCRRVGRGHGRLIAWKSGASRPQDDVIGDVKIFCREQDEHFDDDHFHAMIAAVDEQLKKELDAGSPVKKHLTAIQMNRRPSERGRG